MFDAINKITIVNLLIEVIQYALVLYVLLGVLAEVDAVFVFFYYWLLEFDGETF